MIADDNPRIFDVSTRIIDSFFLILQHTVPKDFGTIGRTFIDLVNFEIKDCKDFLYFTSLPCV